jgi:hypothetical protein
VSDWIALYGKYGSSPHRLSVRALNALLARPRIETLADLAACRLISVQCWKGVGEATLNEYRALLKAHGLAFADDHGGEPRSVDAGTHADGYARCARDVEAALAVTQWEGMTPAQERRVLRQQVARVLEVARKARGE